MDGNGALFGTLQVNFNINIYIQNSVKTINIFIRHPCLIQASMASILYKTFMVKVTFIFN